MGNMPDCPKCHTNVYVTSHIRTSSLISGCAKKVGSVLAYLSTPIGKGMSQDQARRWSREADADFSDMRYTCSKCNTSFDK